MIMLKSTEFVIKSFCLVKNLKVFVCCCIVDWYVCQVFVYNDFPYRLLCGLVRTLRMWLLLRLSLLAMEESRLSPVLHGMYTVRLYMYVCVRLYACLSVCMYVFVCVLMYKSACVFVVCVLLNVHIVCVW